MDPFDDAADDNAAADAFAVTVDATAATATTKWDE